MADTSMRGESQVTMVQADLLARIIASDKATTVEGLLVGEELPFLIPFTLWKETLPNTFRIKKFYGEPPYFELLVTDRGDGYLEIDRVRHPLGQLADQFLYDACIDKYVHTERAVQQKAEQEKITADLKKILHDPQ